jgi:hypothetical protein
MEETSPSSLSPLLRMPDFLFEACLSYLDAPTLCGATMETGHVFRATCTRLMTNRDWLRQQLSAHVLSLLRCHLDHDRDVPFFDTLRWTVLDRHERGGWSLARLVRLATQKRMIQLGVLARPLPDSSPPPLFVHGIYASDNPGTERRIDDPRSVHLDLSSDIAVERNYADPVLCLASEDASDVAGVAWCVQMAAVLAPCEPSEAQAAEGVITETTVSLLASLGDVLWWSGNVTSAVAAYERAAWAVSVATFPCHPSNLHIAINQLALAGQLDRNDDHQRELASRLLDEGRRTFQSAVSELDSSCCHDQCTEVMIQLKMLHHNILEYGSRIGEPGLERGANR